MWRAGLLTVARLGLNPGLAGPNLFNWFLKVWTIRVLMFPHVRIFPKLLDYICCFTPCIFLALICGTWGIYPDLLHIVDLQISHDVISSCLVEMSGSGGPRDQQLKELLSSYEQWCQIQRTMAQNDSRILFWLGVKLWPHGPYFLSGEILLKIPKDRLGFCDVVEKHV